MNTPLYAMRSHMTRSQHERYSQLLRAFLDLRAEVCVLAGSTTDGRLASPRSSLNPEFMNHE